MGLRSASVASKPGGSNLKYFWLSPMQEIQEKDRIAEKRRANRIEIVRMEATGNEIVLERLSETYRNQYYKTCIAKVYNIERLDFVPRFEVSLVFYTTCSINMIVSNHCSKFSGPVFCEQKSRGKLSFIILWPGCWSWTRTPTRWISGAPSAAASTPPRWSRRMTTRRRIRNVIGRNWRRSSVSSMSWKCFSNRLECDADNVTFRMTKSKTSKWVERQ